MLKLQHDMCRHRWQDKIPNTVLIVEHPPVITLGARQSENKLLTEPEQLRENGIEVNQIRRGGGTTAHNPGQVVLYPILKLKSLGLSVNEYIRELEDIGIELLLRQGLNTEVKKGFPGIWTQDGKKIASIGVQLKKWCTMHGLAVNISNDLSIFSNMVPCGIDNIEMTSLLAETTQHVPMDVIKKSLIDIIIERWSLDSEKEKESA